MTKIKPLPPLIADSDLDFLESIKAASQSEAVSPLLYSKTNELIDTIRREYVELSAIFINPTITDFSGLRLLREVLLFRPLTPVFFLSESSRLGITTPELKTVGVRDLILKPVDYAALLRTASFDTKTGLRKEFQPSPGSERRLTLIDEDREFIPVLAMSLNAGCPSLLNIYTRVKPGLYSLILPLQKAISYQALNAYLNLGIRYFYVRRKDHETLLNACDTLTRRVSESPATRS